MIIAGGGGHALEVFDELVSVKNPSDFQIFVNAGFPISDFFNSFKIVSDLRQLEIQFKSNPLFSLGVGTPSIREKFMGLLDSHGGKYFPIRALTSQVSPSALGHFDSMAFSFVGPDTKIGLGVLINVRAHVHHEVEIGDFTEIGPGAMVLGGAKIGKKCKIGAGSVILPGVQVADEVTVGAGAVVTKNLIQGSKVVGVPAKPLPNK